MSDASPNDSLSHYVNRIHTSAVILTASLVYGGESQAHSLPPNLVDHVAFSALQGRCDTSSAITMFAHLKAAGAGAVVVLTCTAVSYPFVTTDHLNSSSTLTNVHNEEIVSLLGDRGAFDVTMATLPSIVRELRRLAMRPKTRQSTRQLSALLGQVEAKDYEAMALQLTSHGMERAVWHRIQPLLFPLWCRYDTDACLSFGLQALRSHVDAWNWLKAIKEWDGEQLEAAKAWYLDRARNEKDNVQWDLRGCVRMGASLALKDRQSFESFLASFPNVSKPLSYGPGTLSEVVRKLALESTYSLPVEEQRDWAEMLTDPNERANMIMRMFRSVLQHNEKKDSSSTGDAMLELADWAWTHFPDEQKRKPPLGLARRMTDVDATATVAWMKSRLDNQKLNRVALGMIAYKNYPKPRPEDQLAWVDALSDPDLQETAAAGIFRRWAVDLHSNSRYESAEAYLRAAEISDSRRERFHQILTNQ